ncbi:MAG: hypothetical protein M3O73_02155 [Actinomycetota bacterium]|nr:hypothetical protein [Actinomycetota bacterium]
MQGRREVLAVGLVWLVWFGAVLLTVAIGLAAGAYTFAQGWSIHHGLWPLFAWDYNWYHFVAYGGYPDGQGGRQYAFFPLWPQLIRWSGSIPDVVAAAALAWAASAAAFFGVAEGTPRARLRTALALACWPGSFVLALAYPDAIALAAAAWAAALALRGRLLAAGLVGVIAALARPSGVLIALPLAWLAWGKGPRAWIGAAAPVAAAATVEAYFWSHSSDPRVFFDAQRQWGRGGPGRFGDWTGHLRDVLERHGLLIALLTVVAAAAILLAWRRFGVWPTVVVAYACAVPLLLAATQSLEGFVDSARAALILPLLAVLWRLGPRYRPWAAFATAVVGLLLLSGTMQSFGRQSLFAFPIFWAIAEGPRWLRYPPLAVLGFCANLVLALMLTRYAP